jgi:hypothetical protein
MAEPLNDILQRALSETAARLAGELEQAQLEARSSTIESLHAAVRRLRQASSITDIGSTLLETAAAWAERVGLFVHKGDTLTGWRAIGFDCAVEIAVPTAPALAQAIETREAVISLAVADHLSENLVARLGLDPQQKVYLFPLCLRQSVVALLYADGEAQPAALELLSGVAELAIEAVSSRPHPRERAAEPDRLELPGARPAVRPPPTDWDKMSPEERDMHLRAQRFARVLVADLQLYRAQEIREGKRARNLYGLLRDEIDKSREVYLRKFGQSAAGGVDYFHLELLHTLADNQEELLGPDYPGPIEASLVG